MSAELERERPLARGIKETAQVVGVSPAFIRKMIDVGELKSTRLGRRVLIKDSDLVSWLNAPASLDEKEASLIDRTPI